MNQQRRLKRIDDEIWREVPNSNKMYYVSNYGRIKSFYFNKEEGQLLKFGVVKGFYQVLLTLNKIKYNYYVHKLVAQIWLPKPSNEYIYVSHKDGNLINNNIKNLEWHTKESLMVKHRELAKLKPKDPNRPKIINNSKLKPSDIKLLKSMIKRGVVQARIAQMFCISEMQVTRIKRGENWGHIKL